MFSLGKDKLKPKRRRMINKHFEMIFFCVETVNKIYLFQAVSYLMLLTHDKLKRFRF